MLTERLRTADGAVRTVAVMIGPEHGTVSPDMVKDAAREALKGAGFDHSRRLRLCLRGIHLGDCQGVCAIGRRLRTAEDERKMGRLRVLLTHMNPDLAMSNELLKKTGSGNLFTVFGEPDVTITSHRRRDTQSRVTEWMSTIRRPASCVRHPRMTSPAGSSTRTTTANSSSCATPTSQERTSRTRSYNVRSTLTLIPRRGRRCTPPRPAPSRHPSTGRIAVKVINHYGDEVLQVYEVDA